MSGLKRHPIRACIRLVWLVATLLAASLDYLLFVSRRKPGPTTLARSSWFQRWSQRTMRALHVEATYVGEPPSNGLLVSNHVSYLDILVLGQHQPLVFVSKADVRDWPIVGWWTVSAGTLFLKREARSDVVAIANQFAPLIEQGAVITIFPEGTSSDGREVLPFRSSLLEPAAAGGWPATPVWIGYSLADGSVEDEVCYWRDMTFGWHILNLLGKKRIQANVMYGAPIPTGLDRKEMARELHRGVCQLKDSFESKSKNQLEVLA